MYVINRQNNSFIISDPFDLVGFPIKLKKNKLQLLSSDLKDKYIYTRFGDELNHLITRILLFLEGDDSSSEDVNSLFEELKFMNNELNTKYKMYLSNYEYNHYMKNIRLLANELKLRNYSYNRSKNYKIRNKA